MGIGKRVREAMEKMQAEDPEAAWIPTSIALDATSKKEYPNVKKVGERYKKFINENFRLISKLAFGGVTIGRMNLGYDHPDIKVDDKGTCSIEEILYHAVRCSLLHEGNLPKNLRFVRRNIIQRKEGVLILPSSLIYGIIIAVIVAPSNARETIKGTLSCKYRGKVIDLNSIWGKKDKLEDFLL